MEMYIDDGITIDEIDAVSGTLTVGKINSKTSILLNILYLLVLMI